MYMQQSFTFRRDDAAQDTDRAAAAAAVDDPADGVGDADCSRNVRKQRAVRRREAADSSDEPPGDRPVAPAVGLLA